VRVAEALLQSLGAEPTFADAVLGDLAEEYALRVERDGVAAARWWYACQAFRSAPYLVRSAARHRGLRERARLAASFAGISLAISLTLLALPARTAPPERLVAKPVVVNNLLPFRLPIRVLDAAGGVLPSTRVRYAWTAGAPVAISPSGVVTCAQPGDAVVRASLGTLATSVQVRCRPVADIRSPGTLELVVGDSAREVPFQAIDGGGRPVTLLMGRIDVGDSTIVALEGQRIRARAEGHTWVETRIGNRSGWSDVHVYQPAQSPEAIRPDQHLAVPVRLARGERREWRLPGGHYFLRVVLNHDGRSTARLVVAGASCTLYGRSHLECAAHGDMSVIVRQSRPASAGTDLLGTLLVWRLPGA
jgi:hypothetical protein